MTVAFVSVPVIFQPLDKLISNRGDPERFRGRDSKWLNRFAWFTCVATLLLICSGGMVTSKGVGLAVPDHRRVGSAVDAVVLLAQPQPRHAHRIVGTGRQRDLGVVRILVMQQRRIVVERRIAGHGRVLEGALGQLDAR